MSNKINSWGLYPWDSSFYGEEFIEPSDVERFKNLLLRGTKVFECVNDNGEYITLKYGEETYQVKPELYEQVSVSILEVGTEVRLMNKPEVTGVIVDVHWHYKEEAPMYFISVNGKRKSKRYMNDELLKIVTSVVPPSESALG